jgi:nitric oxide reductase large subunit
VVAPRHDPRDDRRVFRLSLITYTNAPPIPGRVTDGSGARLFDKTAILHGQQVFLKYGLMEHDPARRRGWRVSYNYAANGPRWRLDQPEAVRASR